MKKYNFLAVLLLFFMVTSCNNNKVDVAIVSTNYGDFEFALLDQTPLHKNNFKKMVKDDYYESMLFHRVIKDFVIQTGNPATKGIAEGETFPDSGAVHTVKAEIVPAIHHLRGAVGAARTSDIVNPERNSSGSHFYIVTGNKNIVTEPMLKSFADSLAGGMRQEVIDSYLSEGGTPHLDGAYTVFGYIIKGMDVIDSIANVSVEASLPVKNVIINNIKIKKVEKSELEQLPVYDLFNPKEQVK